MNILIDHVNYAKIVEHDSNYVTTYDLSYLEADTKTEYIKHLPNGMMNYRYMGTTHIFRVNDKKKFMLLLIATGIEYEELTDYVYRRRTFCTS